MEKERLIKIIANSGYTSRRKAEELILAKKVYVNSILVTELGYKCKKTDEIVINGKHLVFDELEYYVLNKPKNCLLNFKKDAKSIYSILPVELKEKKLLPVNNLSYKDSGLVILTNDGELFYKLTKKNLEVLNTYIIKLKADIKQELVNIFIKGFKINDKFVKFNSFNLINVDKEKKESTIKIDFNESKILQITDCFKHLRLEIISLKRIGFSIVNIDGLNSGMIRYLKPHEVKVLHSLK